MCKLASKRAEVVKSSCGEGIVRGASMTGDIVRVSKLYFPYISVNIGLFIFWFYAAFILYSGFLKEQKNLFQGSSKCNVPVDRWQDPTEIWRPPVEKWYSCK